MRDPHGEPERPAIHELGGGWREVVLKAGPVLGVVVGTGIGAAWSHLFDTWWPG